MQGKLAMPRCNNMPKRAAGSKPFSHGFPGKISWKKLIDSAVNAN